MGQWDCGDDCGDKQQRILSIKEGLSACREIISKPVNIPLNIACSDVLRGILQRSEDTIDVQGSAVLHRRSRAFHSHNVTLMQLTLLDTAIERTIYELDMLEPGDDISSALKYLKSVKPLLIEPPEAVTFPERFFRVNEDLGYCGEAYIRDMSVIVFNMHAYHDKDHTGYIASDTVSTKSTDPGLHEVWQKLQSIGI